MKILFTFILLILLLNSCHSAFQKDPMKVLGHLRKGMSPTNVESIFGEKPIHVYLFNINNSNIIVMKYKSWVAVLLTFKNDKLYYWGFENSYMSSFDNEIQNIGLLINNFEKEDK